MNRKEQIEQAAIAAYGTADCRAAEHFVAGAMWSDANPGLKESEDERVRKALIEMIHDTTGDECEDCYHVSKESVLAWLEKQQSFDKDKLAKGFLRSVATSIMNWLDANTSEGKMCLSNMECEDIENAVCNADWMKIYKYMQKKLEKQGEQPTGKVEPKFKIGDWITNGNYTWEVVNITELVYVLRSQRDIVDDDISYVDENFNLWTIQDAKKGDVVVDKSDGTIGIFESIGHHPDGGSYNDPSYCFLHCRYDDGYFYADFENGNTIDSDVAIPATKEQRDLLFQKMREAGYEWDSDKKELKKIEPKMLDADEVIEWLKTKVYDDSTYGMAMIEQFKQDFGL